MEHAADRRPAAWLSYAWALLAVAVAITARWFASPRIGEQLPYGSVLVATIVISWIAGLRPALVVVGVGGLAANFFLLPPQWSFEAGPDQQRWGLVVFLFLGAVISVFGGFMHVQRARAKEATETLRRAEAALREAHDGLEIRVGERTAELARANASLRASEQQFRVLVEGVQGYAMLMLNAGGEIVGWNAGVERLFGCSAEVVGSAITRLIPGLESVDLGAAARGGASEHEARRGDGTAFPIELAITQLEPAGTFVGIVRDISERQRLEALAEYDQRRTEELRRRSAELEADNLRMQDAARLQSQFLANMSHELRTPLNAIVGFADMLHRGLAGPMDPQHHEFIGDILSSARHLLQLISDMLELARTEAGALRVEPQPVELARTLREVCEPLREVASGRDIALELVDGELGSVTVDPAKLRQIVYNYVSNALKFTPQGGRITVRAALRGAAFRVEVEDTGIGIASEDLRHLFVAFHQLDGGATKRYAGTGLGLALSKRLAEAHGGTVGVDSMRGVGSTFWVELPRQASEAQ